MGQAEDTPIPPGMLVVNMLQKPEEVNIMKKLHNTAWAGHFKGFMESCGISSYVSHFTEDNLKKWANEHPGMLCIN